MIWQICTTAESTHNIPMRYIVSNILYKIRIKISLWMYKFVQYSFCIFELSGRVYWNPKITIYKCQETSIILRCPCIDGYTHTHTRASMNTKKTYIHKSVMLVRKPSTDESKMVWTIAWIAHEHLKLKPHPSKHTTIYVCWVMVKVLHINNMILKLFRVHVPLDCI